MIDTLEVLAANQIQAVGAGVNADEAYAPAFIDVNGLRIAFLGFVDVFPTDYDYPKWEAGADTPGVAWAHETRVRDSVQAAKAQADIVVVLVPTDTSSFNKSLPSSKLPKWPSTAAHHWSLAATLTSSSALKLTRMA